MDVPPISGAWAPGGGGANRPEVVVLVGLQGSGKSSFYRERFARTHVLVSRDLFRHHRRPARRQRELIEAALCAGRSVVVDNTSPTPADRAPILEVAREHGARTACFYFGRDVRGAVARNAGRRGRERVPVVALLATAKRLVAPSPAEGFDAVWAVELTPGGAFAVAPLGEPRAGGGTDDGDRGPGGRGGAGPA